MLDLHHFVTAAITALRSVNGNETPSVMSQEGMSFKPITSRAKARAVSGRVIRRTPSRRRLSDLRRDLMAPMHAEDRRIRIGMIGLDASDVCESGAFLAAARSLAEIRGEHAWGVFGVEFDPVEIVGHKDM